MSEQVTWIDTLGVAHPFDGEGGSLIYPIYGRQGAFAPPYSEIEQQVFGVPGSWERQIVVDPRDLSLPLVIKGTTATDLRARIRQLTYWTDPRRGNGTLRITGPDGMSRDLVCHKISGDIGDESVDNSGVGHVKAIYVFHANYPFFQDPNDTQAAFSTAAPVPFFNSGGAFFPIHLSADGVLSSFLASNNGDVECWPRWQIYGPGVNPVLTNLTTGEVMTLTITLTAGQILYIDTAQFVKTVTREDGSNQYSALSLDSSLWPLEVGDNTCSVAMTGTTSASRIVLLYKQAYNML